MIKKIKGFTLIELLLVIAILGVLAMLITPNMITSLKKGRDARRKADLEQVQKALELYYEDNKAYPTSLDLSSGAQFCHPSPNGCATKIYMEKLPQDLKSVCHYDYVSAGTDYKLYAYLENTQDQGSGVNQAGYGGDCGVTTSCPCRFGVSSANTLP